MILPEWFPAPIQQVLDTHISWVVLAGPFAYKIKKPVDLGFVDYSTIERRRHFCQEELRLNRRLAPDLYLEVVCLGPSGEPAVKMRRFPQEGLLERLALEGRLQDFMLDSVADQLAEFHRSLPPGLDWGRPGAVHAPVRENFAQVPEPALEAWSEAEFARLSGRMEQRRQDGFIRECHGDLHLRNLVHDQGHVIIFDGIEFSPELRWIDVHNETAFLFMDLERHGRADLAYRFLNRYLEHTGDYAGLDLLAYYRTYRAVVRAKVAALTGRQAEVSTYLELARHSSSPTRPELVLTYGPSGCGKTWHSQRVLEQHGFIRLRSDVERKRLFGLEAEERSGSGLHQGIYTGEATRRTYARLLELSRQLLAAGHKVLVDAAFLEPEQRQPFRELGVSVRVLQPPVDPEVLRRRLRERGDGDASEADLEVLEAQLAHYAPLSPAEWEPYPTPPGALKGGCNALHSLV